MIRNSLIFVVLLAPVFAQPPAIIPFRQPSTVVVQKWFGYGPPTAAMTYIASQPGDTYVDLTNQVEYWCAAQIVTFNTLPACTSVASGAWTQSGGSAAYTAITSVPTVSLLGNPTGSTANASAITLGTGLSFSGSVLNAVSGALVPNTTPVTGGTNGYLFGTNGTVLTQNSLAGWGIAPIASPTFTGTVTIPNGGVLGTPTSINLSNGTSYPVASLANLGAGVATWLATPSGANLGSALTTPLPLTAGGTGATSLAGAGIATLGANTFTAAQSIPVGATGVPGLYFAGNNTVGFYSNNPNQWTWTTGSGDNYYSLIAGSQRWAAGAGLCWNSSPTDSTASSCDTEVSRGASGIIAVGTSNSTGDTTGTLQLLGLQLEHPYSAAGSALPVCASGLLLKRVAVSDATLNTPGSTYVSGGTYTIAVQCTYNSTGPAYTWLID